MTYRSRNARLHWLISELHWKGQPLNVQRLAAAALGNARHSHLSQVLAGHPGRGGQTRGRLVRWLKRHFPEQTPPILDELGWDEQGRLRNVPHGMFHPSGKEACVH